MLVAFFDAQHINFRSGGGVIAPWEILPGYTLAEWIEAAKALDDVPAIKERIKAQRQVFEKARRAHKDYARLHYPKLVN